MRYAALLVALFVAVSAVPGVAGAAPPPEIGGPTTEFHVYLQNDGDARWQVKMTFQLDSANETAAFRALADRFEAGDADVGPDVRFFRTAAARASTVADREMTVTNVTYSSTVDEPVGTLRLEFVWTDFLDGGGDRYILQDALRTPGGGTWLRSLEDGQLLRIYTPSQYDIDESDEARQVNDSLVIDGPDSFDESSFRVVYGRSAPEPNGNDTVPDLGAVTVGATLLLLLTGAAVWVWQRETDDEGAVPLIRPGSPDEDAGAGAVETPDDGASDAGAGAATGASDGVDLDLLSDEERVEHLLERNGGRMRQADIVTETDWSDAKVSQLLSRMADEERVEKLRLGRENLISLPDADLGNRDGSER